MIESVLDQANISLAVGGIVLEFGYNTIAELVDDATIVDSILLGIQVRFVDNLQL